MTYREALEDNIRRFRLEHSIHGKIRKEEKRIYGTLHQTKEEGVPGSILHINIPAGTELELLNLLEIISPEGISIDARLPFLSGDIASSVLTSGLNGILNSITKAGGSFEIIPS